MAIGTKDLNVESLDGMDNGRLQEALKSSKEELFNLRFQAATGQLDNSSRLKAVKRDIARIYTILRERELGIREDVVAPGKVGGAVRPGIARQVRVPVAVPVPGADGGDLHRPAAARGQQVGVGLDDLDDADPDGAKAGDAETEGGGHGGLVAWGGAGR